MGFDDNNFDAIPDLDLDDSGYGINLGGGDDDFDAIPDLDDEGTDSGSDDTSADDGGTSDTLDTDSSDASKESGDVIGQLDAMFKQYGIEHNTTQYKDKNITIEQAKAVFREQVGLEYLARINPSYAAALKHGINPDAYQHHMAFHQERAAMDDEMLIKNTLFNQYQRSEQEAGTLPKDQKEAYDHLMELTDARYAKMKPEQMKEYATNVRNGHNNAIKQLPELLKQAEMAQSKANVEKYNKGVNDYLSNGKVKEYIDNGGAVPYSKAEDKEGFKSYVKQMLSIGDNGIELMHKLENDGAFLMDTLRLLYEKDKGSLKDIDKKAVKTALDKLDAFGNGGRAQSSGSGEITIGNKKFRLKDTTKKH